MRRPCSSSVVCALVLLAATSGAAGCSQEYEEFFAPLTDPSLASTSTGSTTTTTNPPACIPSNGAAIEDDCGVFVSSSLGKDTNAGTKEAPFATIAKALGAATAKPVYLCGESFAEAVEVKAGALVYGALDCTANWSYASDKRSVIAAPADAIALRVTSKATLEMFDVNVTAASATVAGGSSIAMLAEVDTDVTLTRSELTAGDGAKGADGAPFDMPAMSGGDGLPGKDACTGPSTIGGLSVQNVCDAETSSSGLGGTGTEPIGGDGSDGKPSGTMNRGIGEDVMACTAGTVGDAGMVGSGGPGASGLGTLGNDGFAGVAGGEGLPGKVGQGGGGGGGAKGGSAGKTCNTIMSPPGNAGASGASGGAGGCGGLGGKGGAAGGSSIGILSLGAKLTFEGVKITTTKGGSGGNGGDGQAGGSGGNGATGGKVPATATDLKPGCAGGNGGSGGSGGKGGGGLGGHSIGIAHSGDAPEIKGAQITQGGSAGDGGLGDSAANDGAKGVVAVTQKF